MQNYTVLVDQNTQHGYVFSFPQTCPKSDQNVSRLFCLFVFDGN